MSRRRSILFVINEDWFFLSHFQAFAETAAELGLDVAIMANAGPAARELEARGWRVLPLAARRGSLNPLRLARQALEARRIMRRERPDIVHAISLPSILGAGPAALQAGVPRIVLAPTGLGHLWISDGGVVRAVRGGVRTILAALFRSHRVTTVFENDEDPVVFGLDPADRDKVVLVGGAGVDIRQFAPHAAPSSGPLRCAVVARMTRPKGVPTVVEAVRIARGRGVDVTLDLYGAPDSGNRTSLGEAQLAAWSREPGIAWHGPTRDVAGVWRRSDVAVLLSLREGLPRALVEAMACGRPVVASAVPGCRTLVRDGIDGLLVPPSDPEAAAAALQRLAADPGLRHAMGRAARQRIVESYSTEAVKGVLAGLYARLLDEDHPDAPWTRPGRG